MRADATVVLCPKSRFTYNNKCKYAYTPHKMAETCILGPIASTKMAMEGGKNVKWQRCVTLRTTALDAA
jgi:hypothetical protein